MVATSRAAEAKIAQVNASTLMNTITVFLTVGKG